MLKNRFQLNEWLADRLIDLRDSIWEEKSKISNEQDFYNVIHDYIELYVGENGQLGSAQKDLDDLNDSTDFDNNIWQKLSPLFSSSQIHFIDGVKEKPVKNNTQKHQELKQIECNLMQKKVQLKKQLVEPLVIDYFEKEAQNTITRTLQQMKQNNSAFKQPLDFQTSERAIESD
jgi:hypothetical protein